MKKALTILATLIGAVSSTALSNEKPLEIGDRIPDLSNYEIAREGKIKARDERGDLREYRNVVYYDPEDKRFRVYAAYMICNKEEFKVPFGMLREKDDAIYLNNQPFDFEGKIDRIITDVQGPFRRNLAQDLPKCPLGRII
jgi:hypothetical protein